MKLFKLLNGAEVKGEIISQDEETVTIEMDLGELKMKRATIAGSTDILDCTKAPIGQYIETPSGVYVKIENETFRLVKGPYTSPIDVQSIQDGRYVDHEEVFADEEPEVAEIEE